MHVTCLRVALAAALALAAAPAARAQGESILRGVIVADADGVRLGAATVTLQPQKGGAPRSAVTGADGRFAFAQVAAGEYLLHVAADGFAPREEPMHLVPREVRDVTIALAVAAQAVTVQVTGERAPLPPTHSPSSTSIGAERVQELPPAVRQGLPEAMVTAAPGMIRGHDDFVHVRGEEVALNPVINGVAFWENPHAVFSAGFSPEVIDIANVMTGAFPAEYGNRFGGVVDVVTKSGLRMHDAGSVTASGGEAGRASASAEFGSHREGLGLYLFGSAFASDRFLSPPAAGAVHDHGSGAHVMAQVDRALGESGALRILVMGDGAGFEIPRTPEDAALQPDANATQHTRQQSAIVGWTRAWAALAADATVYQRWSSSRLRPVPDPEATFASNERTLLTVGAKATLARLARRHTFKMGIDVVGLRPDEQLAYRGDGIADVDFSGRRRGGQVSAFAQDDVRLGDRVTADLGLRVDHYDLVEAATHASPRLNLAVTLPGRAVVHVSYNDYFAAPPIEGVLSSAAGLTAFVEDIQAALPPVKPTTERQFETGVTLPAGPLHLGAAGYYRASDNPVHTTVWPDARLYSYASFDRAEAYGLEVKAEAPGLARYGVTAYANYALGRVYFHNPGTGGFVTEAEHLESTDRFLAPMDQTHTFTSGATYRHARSGVSTGASIEYGSGTPMETGGPTDGARDEEHDGMAAHAADGTSRVPGHVIASLWARVDLWQRGTRGPRLSLRADVENVADHTYLVARESEFSPGEYSIPRLVSVTATVRF